MLGYPFTWERSRGTTDWAEEKLDRTLVTEDLVTEDWLQLYPTALDFNEDAHLSDHTAIVLRTDQMTPRRNYQLQIRKFLDRRGRLQNTNLTRVERGK